MPGVMTFSYLLLGLYAIAMSAGANVSSKELTMVEFSAFTLRRRRIDLGCVHRNACDLIGFLQSYTHYRNYGGGHGVRRTESDVRPLNAEL